MKNYILPLTLAVAAATVMSSTPALAAGEQIKCSVIGPQIFSETVAKRRLGLQCQFGLTDCEPDGTELFNNGPNNFFVRDGASNGRSPGLIIFSDAFPVNGPIDPNLQIRMTMGVPSRLFSFSTEIINSGIITVNSQRVSFTYSAISNGPFVTKVAVPSVTRAGVFRTVQADVLCAKQ